MARVRLLPGSAPILLKKTALEPSELGLELPNYSRMSALLSGESSELKLPCSVERGDRGSETGKGGRIPGRYLADTLLILRHSRMTK
jgi:hypothetical protein